MAFFKVMASS